MKPFQVSGFAVAVVVLGWASCAQGSCGTHGRGGGGGGGAGMVVGTSGTGGPESSGGNIRRGSIQWGCPGSLRERLGLKADSSKDTTEEHGHKHHYLIYFCTKQTGENAGMVARDLRGGKRTSKATIFESSRVVGAFIGNGFHEFYKVIARKETADLAKKYGVTQDNTLVLCAANGEMVTCLAGPQCNPANVLKLLKQWPQIHKAWQEASVTK